MDPMSAWKSSNADFLAYVSDLRTAAQTYRAIAVAGVAESGNDLLRALLEGADRQYSETGIITEKEEH